MEFTEKVVLITGAGRGIGEALAHQLADEGAHLVIADIDAGLAQAVAGALTQRGAQTLAVTCDVADAASIEAARRCIAKRFGHVDVLINNAAAQQFGPGDIREIDLDRYRQSFEINVLGDVRMVDAFLPEMLKRRSGYIVNTASSLVIRPNPVVQHLMPYVTSKGAVLAWTYALSCAIRPHGIGVSLFCPGLTTTRPDGLTYPQRMGWFDRTPAELAAPASASECAERLLRGLRDERFVISLEPDYEQALIDFAQAGLNPDFYSL
jgi:2-hydroxycyclohexanecarboxyl-CoA dehydrogenase